MVTSATLRNVRISPRKVRLVADLIRGKTVDDVMVILTHLPKGSALPLLTLLKSAVANAKQRGKDETAKLRVSAITVDMAQRLKRFMPHAQGRATTILKHASHIILTLDEHTPKLKKLVKQTKKETTKATPAKVAEKPAEKKSEAPAAKA
jgi:large subunit ribosomal protein L22